ncbi:MAG TPA: hypothetical protein VMR51_00635 [Patescibacteria group bacterium]|nr:hypothetical protein [Patescibacteria group bacterium]
MKLKKILDKLLPIKNFVVRYAVLIFIVCVVGIFSFMTLLIAHYSNLEPTQYQIEDTKSSLKTFKLDDNAVQKINQLQDQNINIETLFNNGRANPFE